MRNATLCEIETAERTGRRSHSLFALEPKLICVYEAPAL